MTVFTFSSPITAESPFTICMTQSFEGQDLKTLQKAFGEASSFGDIVFLGCTFAANHPIMRAAQQAGCSNVKKLYSDGYGPPAPSDLDPDLFKYQNTLIIPFSSAWFCIVAHAVGITWPELNEDYRILMDGTAYREPLLSLPGLLI